MPIARSIGALRRALPVLLAFIPPGASAQAQEPAAIVASASALLDRPGGCLLVQVTVTEVRKASGVESRRAQVTLFQDASGAGCASGPALELLATGETDGLDFVSDARLDHASARATIPLVFHAMSARRTFSLEARWQGVGKQVFPNLSSHAHGFRRPATLSLSLSDGTTDWAAHPYSTEAVVGVSVPGNRPGQ